MATSGHPCWVWRFWSRWALTAPPPSGHPSLLRCAYCPRYRSGACWRIVWALAGNSRGAFANCSRHSASSHISCAVALWRQLRLAEPPCRRFCQTQLARAPFGSGRRSLAGSGTPARTSALNAAVCSVLVALGSQRPSTPFGESGIAFGFCSFVGYRTVVGKHISPTPLCCSVGLEVAAATSNLRGVFVSLALPRAILLWWRPSSSLTGPCRNPRRRFGAPAPMLRRRGAPAPSPPPPSLRSGPRHGGRGQGR